MQSPTHWCLKECPAHIKIQSSARLSLLTFTCSVVCLLPQAYSNKLRLAALETPVFHTLWCLAAQRKGMVIKMKEAPMTRSHISTIKGNRRPLPKVRRVPIGSKSGATFCSLTIALFACIRHYFPRQGGNLNCAGAHHGTLTPPRISPSCVNRSIIIG